MWTLVCLLDFQKFQTSEAKYSDINWLFRIELERHRVASHDTDCEVTVSCFETSLSKCRTSFLKTMEHTLQQQNIRRIFLTATLPYWNFEPLEKII